MNAAADWYDVLMTRMSFPDTTLSAFLASC